MIIISKIINIDKEICRKMKYYESISVLSIACADCKQQS